MLELTLIIPSFRRYLRERVEQQVKRSVSLYRRRRNQWLGGYTDAVGNRLTFVASVWEKTDI